MSNKISILDDILTKECFMTRFNYGGVVNQTNSFIEQINFLNDVFESNNFNYTVIGETITKFYKRDHESVILDVLDIYNDGSVVYSCFNYFRHDKLISMLRDYKLKQIEKL